MFVSPRICFTSSAIYTSFLPLYQRVATTQLCSHICEAALGSVYVLRIDLLSLFSFYLFLPFFSFSLLFFSRDAVLRGRCRVRAHVGIHH